MAHTPADSRIAVTDSLQERIANASMEEIKVILAEEAVRTGLITRDAYSPDILLEVEPAATPRKFARTVEINGVKKIVEADTEHEVDRAVIELYRAAQNQQQRQQQAQPRTDDRRFTKQQQEDAVKRSDLDLRFRRGEINVDTYIAESGALDRYLESKGVSVESLIDVSNQRYTQGWAEASERFKNSKEGADWPGGDQNLKIIGEEIIAMGLQESEDKLGALVAAYQKLKAEDRLVPTPGQELARELADATSFSDIARLAKGYQGR
jgi:hypothetical protein